MKSLVLAIILLGTIGSLSYSQIRNYNYLKDNISNNSFNFPSINFNKSSLSDTSDECSITLSDGSILKDVNFLGSDDTTFTITKSGINNTFPINRIHKITFERHKFWTGFAIGAISSVCFWEFLGLVSSKDDKNAPGYGLVIGLLFAPPTGLITGLITEFGTKDDVYNFSSINPSSRANRLRKIIMEHKQ